jgi:hypothetical protein
MGQSYRILSTALILCNFQQAESVRYAAWECDWVGTPVPFQRCLVFIIAAANKEFRITAGKFVPVAYVTMMNVRILPIIITAF